ncbi:hypothetical protein [Rugosimonospora africana]|uniref:Uncharacterized protein n=1 Tax=Rugosimonospora africana TaxID=556532 RepID=A0A8J3QVP6_9ACTN|nr:hypothetical protein [Rugosimonospora africana]GIH16897.1 hypothetical protein Raf01_50690 [Rugosimonospora africana]
MIDVFRQDKVRPVRRWRQWPRWVATATFCWAVAYAGFGVLVAATGTPALYHGPHRWPAGFDWAIVAVAAAVAAAALAATRPRRRPGARRAVLSLLWGLCLPVAMLAFGLLMDLIELVFAQTVDSWLATANQVLAAAGAVLLIGTALSFGHATRGSCPRCGRVHDASFVAVRPQPSTPPRRVRRLAWAGAAGFVPYAAMKTTWAVGGTFAGMSGAEIVADFRRNGTSGLILTLESWGIDVTALLAALGLFLLFGLVRPWGQVFPRWIPPLRGRRVPRWLPLIPAWLGAATLAPYGAAGVVYCALGTAGLVTMPRGQFPSSGDALLVAWCGLGPFAVFGAALAAAAWSYQRRTRPACGVVTEGRSGSRSPTRRPR